MRQFEDVKLIIENETIFMTLPFNFYPDLEEKGGI